MLLIIFYCTTTGHNIAAQQQCQRTHVPFQRAPGSDNTTTTLHTRWLPSQPQTALPLMADPSELLVVETNAETTVTHSRMVAIKNANRSIHSQNGYIKKHSPHVKRP